ncbi:hypothetical protein SAMN02745205_01519 [Porphyromonas cangingivalis]|uniref:Uncharacterized protein n=1 Tax=Porphyromonas cangingivalis TaxID=36874 RepID=A0A1T4MG68_PORCN|nr:hypothetical protein SAMN02745205_01519 [Porphyromonas cangingivalis]
MNYYVYFVYFVNYTLLKV